MQRIISRSFRTSIVSLDKTLFVRNIAWSVNESDLAAAFAEHGDITSCRIITDRFTGRSRGFAFIESSDASTENIIAKMNGAELGGRQLIVAESDPSKKRPTREESAM